MNKIFLIAMMITTTVSANATVNIHSKKGNFRIVQASENVVTIEAGAYENLLRVVDEKNRQNGIYSDYLNRATTNFRKSFDHIDIIPVAHYTNEYDDYIVELGGLKVPSRMTDTAFNYRNAADIINNLNTIPKESLEKTSYIRSGAEKRFYFGNGNIAKDIIFTSKDEYDKKLEENKDNIRYTLEGTYKSIGSNLNQLNISMDDYYSKIQGKNRTEVSKYLKEKLLSEKNIRVIQKGDELYTLDENLKEWKVLWTLEPVSVFRTVQEDFEDTVFTKIFVYDSSTPADSSGRTLYAKNGNIIVEDRYDYINDISLKKNNYGGKEKLEKLIQDAKEKAENGGSPSNAIEHYFKDKKNLSEIEFNAKWVTPFMEGGEFQQNIKSFQKEATELKAKHAILEKEYNEVNIKVEEIEKSGKLPTDFYLWSWKYKSEQEKSDYLVTKTEEEKKIIKNYVEYSKIKSDKSDEKLNIELELQEGLLKKYGFYKSYYGGGNPDEKKWVDRVIWDYNIIRNLLGKNVEFRGKGRIEGTIDLGGGVNELTVREQFTGKYGTNIILGAYSKLKNIKYVNVAGQVGSDSGVSISGRASLTMDIDPSIKNAEGHIIQHALKDSDDNIIFKQSGNDLKSEARNDFFIELMASRIEKDSTINMGRKIDYLADEVGLDKPVEMTIPFISDSIIHNIANNKKFGADGNSLLDIKIKDNIKRLSDEENKVYESIKNANKIAVLQPTITTTNKRTTFNVSDDEREKTKNLSLAKYLKEKTSKDIIKDLSEFHLNKTDIEELSKAIESIKIGKALEDNIKREEKLKKQISEITELKKSEEYKNINLKSTLEELNKFNIEDLRTKRDDITVRTENTQKIKLILDKININDLENLKNTYSSLGLGELFTSLSYANNKVANVADKWDFGFLLNSIDSLKEALEKQLAYNSEKLQEDLTNIDKDLVENLEKYSHDKVKEYRLLKGKIYYTVREEEVLYELKNLIAQLNDRNIYSKLNKVSKNEISTYTNIPFEINHSLSDKKYYARGGFISNRTVQDNFKGNIYTAYGLYEKEYDKGKKYGFILGGGNTSHNEVYTRTLNTVATESSIKGVSAYLGAYMNREILNNLNWINGFGMQYGTYTVKREAKNTYQTLNSKGKLNTVSANAYTGLVANYPIHEDVAVQVKGLLSYSAVKQSKVNESGDLPLNINSKLYNYVDAELGVSFTKTLYGDNMLSSLSAGIYGVAGLSGYKNENLKTKINGSNSSFEIKGDKIKKDAVKILIDYNVQTDEGYNYGLEGTYISNSKESNVKIGVKAGYVF